MLAENKYKLTAATKDIKQEGYKNANCYIFALKLIYSHFNVPTHDPLADHSVTTPLLNFSNLTHDNAQSYDSSSSMEGQLVLVLHYLIQSLLGFTI